MKRTLLPLVALLLAPQVALHAADRTVDKPNILLIVADDLGWSDVGWHGGFAKTPQMDKLVREGVELDQHYVQPVCTPTRTALLSGRYPGRFGPHALAPSNLRAMPLGTVTIASALKSMGYHTYQSGKWHLGARSEWGPTAFGFDHGYGTLTGAADPWTHKYRLGPYEDTWHRDGKLMHEEGNATELVAAEALRRIEEKHFPWFVYVPFHAVHTPVDATQEFKQLYDGHKFHDDPEKQDSRLRMAAMISQIDAKIGQFVAALERTSQRDSTLIVFTSDNGGIESLQNAYVGNVGHSPLNSENDPLRGQKNQLYEGGTRVCAFANWPGKLAPRKFATPMHVVDWFPTIASLVGYEPPADLHWDGINQWPPLSGAATHTEPRTIYIAMKGGQALRRGDWKLISTGKKVPQLFNIAADPYEKDDLASSRPDKVAEFARVACRTTVQGQSDTSQGSGRTSKIAIVMKRTIPQAIALVMSLAVVALAEEPAGPAVVLKLNGVVTDPTAIDYDALPTLAGQHAVVCPTTDAFKFQLHNYLIHHDGKYWCMFSHGPVVEDVPTQLSAMRRATTGWKWSAARPLTPIPSEPYAYIARGLWLRNGELLALVAHYRGKGAFGDNKELKLQAYVWDPQTNAWRFKATLYQDAINNFAPQQLPSGEWLMTRRDSRFNVFMLAGGVKALNDWQSFPVVGRSEVPKFSPDEPFWWQLPGGRLHALFRDNGGSGRLYQAFSGDNGRTWSQPRISNFPNASSKCYPLKLSSGRWAMISNASPAQGRRELHLSLSQDGLTFTKMARLAIPSDGTATLQYPHAIEHDGHLLIAFSRKKNQTEVLRVPLPTIEQL